MANLDYQQGKEEEADDGDIDSLFEDEEEEEDQGVDTFGKQDENNEFAQEEEDNHTTSTDPGHRHGYDHHHANSQDSSDEPDAEKLERVKAKLRRMQENQKAQKESRRAIFINKALNPEKTITKGPARSSIINSSKPVSKTKKIIFTPFCIKDRTRTSSWWAFTDDRRRGKGKCSKAAQCKTAGSATPQTNEGRESGTDIKNIKYIEI
jgi:hypothetical protein